MTYLCLSCNAPLQHASLGRKSKYCSSACKQAAYRQNVTLRNDQRNVTLPNKPSYQEALAFCKSQLEPHTPQMRNHIMALVLLEFFPSLLAIAPELLLNSSENQQLTSVRVINVPASG